MQLKVLARRQTDEVIVVDAPDGLEGEALDDWVITNVSEDDSRWDAVAWTFEIIEHFPLQPPDERPFVEDDSLRTARDGGDR